MIWLPPGQRELEEEVLKDVSIEEAWKHFVWHQKECAPRLAGTPSEKKQVEYYRRTLKKWEIPLVVQQYDAWVVDGPTWGPNRSPNVFAEVDVVSPEKKRLQCGDLSGSTKPEGIRAEVVDIGRGTEEEIRAANVAGKITMTFPIDKSTPQPDLHLLNRFGALGHIMVSWRPIPRSYPRNASRYSMGNPTLDELETIIDLPLVDMPQPDGDYIRGLMEKGPVQIHLRNKTVLKWKKALQPYVKITGTVDPQKHVVVGGHQDALGAGATCNSNGIAVLLEFLRVIWKHRDKIKRSIKWFLFSGHESGGDCTGSLWYLDEHWDDIMENQIATYTLDTPFIAKAGLSPGTVGYRSKNSPELRKFHEQVIRDIVPRARWDIEATRDTWHPGEKYVGLSCNHRHKAGDVTMWPWDIGVPAIFDGKRNSKLTPYPHTPEDTIEMGGTPDLMEDPIKVLLVSTMRFCNCPVLPLDFINVAEQYIEALEHYQKKVKEAYDLTPLIEMAETTKIFSKKLDDSITTLMQRYETTSEKTKFESIFKTINKALMQMSRILNPPFFASMARGKYEHDGYFALEHPIPSLLPVIKLGSMNPNSGEFKALRTKVVRNRNRIADTLRNATALAENTTSAIEGFTI